MFQRAIGKRCKYKGFKSCDVIVDGSLERCERCGGPLEIETAINKTLIAAMGLAISMGVLVIAFLILKIAFSPSDNKRTGFVEQSLPSTGEAAIVKLLRSIYSDGVKDRQEQAKLEEAARQLSIRSNWLSQKEEEIKSNSDKLLYGIKRGLSYAAHEDYVQAEREFKYCVEIDPENSFAWSNLAAADMKTGQIEEARRACEKAVTLDPHSWIAHYNLGSLYAIRGDKDNAIRELSEALRLVNESQSPQMTRAEISEQIRGDRSFDSLQKDRRFKELVARN